MENICSICSCSRECDTQMSSLTIAKIGGCLIRNKNLEAKYSAMSDEELIAVLEEQKEWPDYCWYKQANKVYKSRFSKDYE